MKLSVAELADRATILSIKKANGLDVAKELEQIQAELKNYQIEPALWNELRELNQKIWNGEEEMGQIALRVKDWNKRRREIKQKLLELYPCE